MRINSPGSGSARSPYRNPRALWFRSALLAIGLLTCSYSNLTAGAQPVTAEVIDVQIEEINAQSDLPDATRTELLAQFEAR